MGYASFVEAVKANQGMKYRVRVGPELTRALADKLQKQLAEKAKLNTKIFLFELEDREPMIIHELNDFSDFREVHEKVRVMGKRQALERL